MGNRLLMARRVGVEAVVPVISRMCSSVGRFLLWELLDTSF
jgi:hypothetical protein